MKRVLSFLLPLVGLAIFFWIIRGTGIDSIVDTFRRVDPARLWVFPLFVAFFVWIRGLRWYVLMRTIGIDYSMRRSSMVWSIGFFAGAITPAKVGDALRAYYLSRDTHENLGRCILTLAIDRLMDLGTVLLAGLVTTLIFSYYYMHLPSLWLIVAVVVVFFAAAYLALHRGLMRRLMGPIFRFVTPDRYQDELSRHFHSFYDGLRVYAERWPQTLLAYVYALVFWFSVVLLAYTVTQVLALDIPFRYVVLMMPVLTLMEALPVSISGLGTREAAAIFFFSAIGAEAAEAVGFSLLYVIAGTYLTALVGFVAWLVRPSRIVGGGNVPPSGGR